MGKDDISEKIHAVFCVKPIKGTSNAVIKCLGHVKEGESVGDEPIKCQMKDLDGNIVEDQYVYNVSETIYVRFFHCNIQDSFLMTSRILPVLCATVMYQNNLLCGLLFNIFIDFVVHGKITSEKQLIGSKLDGKFIIRIKLNEKDIPKILDLGDYESEEYVIEVLKSIIETNEIKGVIAEMLEERRKERLEKLGSMDDIEIPKPKYNFSEMVARYKKDGEDCFKD